VTIYAFYAMQPYLLRAWQETVRRSLRQLAETPEHQLDEPRGVGRMAMPSNVRGLLFHAAEHATRHVGQIKTTAKIVAGLRLCIAMFAVMSAACVAEKEALRRDGPPIPYEDAGACPFEGCAYREWIANAAVAIRADRHVTAPVAFSLREGEKVAALGGVVVTTRPGRVGNGACAGGPRPCVGRVVEPWQFEWWVQIRDASGRIGWTQEPEKFDNKDALA
jgi:hypothetical protein